MAPKAERKPTSLPSPASSGPHYLSDLVHHSLPLAHPIPAILDFSQMFKHIIHRPTPGPLHWLFPLPRMLFPKLQTWLPPSLPSGLYLMCPFQGVFLCPLCLKCSPHHSQCLLDPLLLPFPHTFHYLKHLIFYSLLLFTICWACHVPGGHLPGSPYESPFLRQVSAIPNVQVGLQALSESPHPCVSLWKTPGSDLLPVCCVALSNRCSPSGPASAYEE